MDNTPYPDGLDILWLAADEAGEIGAFISAGIGPIPAIVLNGFDLELVDHMLRGMPDNCGIDFASSLGFSDRFELLGKKGVYVYDWTDNQRVGGYVRSYEKVVEPLPPVAIDRFPEYLRNAASSVVFSGLSFRHTPLVRPQDLFECPRPRN